MKLLFDENLSPRLAKTLADVFPGSSHVHQCELASLNDSVIWEYAKQHDFTIVSKDSDFQERGILLGYPPKVIWLRVTNCTTAEIERLLRATSSRIVQFIEISEDSCLVLSLRHNQNNPQDLH